MRPQVAILSLDLHPTGDRVALDSAIIGADAHIGGDRERDVDLELLDHAAHCLEIARLAYRDGDDVALVFETDVGLACTQTMPHFLRS